MTMPQKSLFTGDTRPMLMPHEAVPITIWWPVQHIQACACMFGYTYTAHVKK